MDPELCASLMKQCDEIVPRTGGAVMRPTNALAVDESLKHVLHGHIKYVSCVATYTLTDDGATTYAVSGGWDLTIRHWNLSTGELVNTLTGHTNWVQCVATYQQDGETFAVSGGHDNTLRVWDLTTGKHITTLKGHTDGVRGVATYTTDSVVHVVSASSDRTLLVCCMNTMQHERMLRGHSDAVTCVVTYTQDSAACAVSGSLDKTLRLWRLSTGECVRTLTGHTRSIMSVATYCPGDAVMAVSGARDGTIRAWDLALGKCTATMRDDESRVYCVAVYCAASKSYAVAGTNRDTVEVWDIVTRRCIDSPRGHTDNVNDVAVYFPASASRAVNVVSASKDTKLRVVSFADASRIYVERPGHTHDISSGALYCDAASGQLHAVTASEDKTLRVWDARTGASLRTLSSHTDKVTCLAVFSDSNDTFAVSGSADMTLRQWRLASGDHVQTMTGHTWGVTDVATYQRNGICYAVSASLGEGTLRQWNTSTGQQDWLTSATYVWRVAPFQHAGAWYAVATDLFGHAVVLDLASGETVRSLDFKHRCPSTVQHAPDVVLIAGADNALLQVCDPSSNAALRIIDADAWITAIATTVISSTPYAVVATDKPSLQIFNLITGARVCRVNTPAVVQAVAFAADVIAYTYASQVQFYSLSWV